MVDDRVGEAYGTSAELSQHYVYLYRDDRGKARYVGYGKSHSRASSHLSGSHNQKLNELIATGKYSLEIAGPFGDEMTGRAIETALISALKPDCNINQGPGRWRFRPLGIPEEFSERLTLPPLERADFIQAGGEVPSSSLLFVRINNTNFDDGRVGYDPSNPPTDKQILERMDRWWQLGSYLGGWIADPSTSPRTLLGVTGSPGSQIVIGAVLIDPEGWKNVLRDGAFCQVPTKGPQNLDAFNLRGRKISTDANLKFGSFSNQIFLMLDRNGQVTGGRPSRRE